MTINLDQYRRLKAKVEEATAAAARAEGALEQQMKKLKEDFGCESVGDAEELLVALKEKEERLEDEYEGELATFEKKWGDKV